MDRLALERRADVNEEIVLALNKQVVAAGGLGGLGTGKGGAGWSRLEGGRGLGGPADVDRLAPGRCG